MCNFSSPSFFLLCWVGVCTLWYIWTLFVRVRCYCWRCSDAYSFSEKCVLCQQLGCTESRLGSVNCCVKLRGTSIKGMNWSYCLSQPICGTVFVSIIVSIFFIVIIFFSSWMGLNCAAFDFPFFHVYKNRMMWDGRAKICVCLCVHIILSLQLRESFISAKNLQMERFEINFNKKMNVSWKMRNKKKSGVDSEVRCTNCRARPG